MWREDGVVGVCWGFLVVVLMLFFPLLVSGLAWLAVGLSFGAIWSCRVRVATSCVF